MIQLDLPEPVVFLEAAARAGLSAEIMLRDVALIVILDYSGLDARHGRAVTMAERIIQPGLELLAHILLSL